MNAAKQAEKKFELVPTDDPKLVGFKVALNNEFFEPSNIPNFATAYSAWTYRNSLRSAWDSYVYVRSEEDKGETWFHFLPSLPSTVKTTQRIDPIWGLVTVFEYLQNTTSVALPDIASALNAYAPINTAGYTLNAEETSIAKGLSKFVVELVASNTVTKPFERLDEDSGSIIEGYDLYTLDSLAPSSVVVQTDGSFATVDKVSHNLWKSRYDKVTALPTSYASALSWDTQDKMYWPPVLVNWSEKIVVNQDATAWNKLFATSIREGYSGDVKVGKKLWWQSTPYTIPDAESMVASRIEVDGNLEHPSIRETLHGMVVYAEENYIADLSAAVTDVRHRMVVWTFSPTNYTDWPATITRVTQEYYKGGYRCLEEVFNRPVNYDGGQVTVTERGWISSDGLFYG